MYQCRLIGESGTEEDGQGREDRERKRGGEHKGRDSEENARSIDRGRKEESESRQEWRERERESEREREETDRTTPDQVGPAPITGDCDLWLMRSQRVKQQVANRPHQKPLMCELCTVQPSPFHLVKANSNIAAQRHYPIYEVDYCCYYYCGKPWYRTEGRVK